MKKITYLFLLFISISAFAQTPQKKSTEWDALDQTFLKVIQSLIKEDKQAFLQLSLNSVDCPDCPEVDGFTKDGAYLPADVFFFITSEFFTKSPIYKALSTRGYTFTSATIKKYKAPATGNIAKDTKVYDVWVDTYLPNQLAKGHKGTGHSFRFVKINGKFKFIGLLASERN